MTIRGPFICRGPLALFLDVDGTLLEIASTPSAVRVPAALRNTLTLASQREGGALALISGRCIGELDRLFSPYVFPAAGRHGVEWRDAQGNFYGPIADAQQLANARQRLTDLLRRDPGLLLEDKVSGLAMHYRRAPQHVGLVQRTMLEIAETLGDQYMLRAGKCVIELCPAGFSKRTAIESFMQLSPFAGRTPVFIGDDLGDEEGFEAVNAMGGCSIRVGKRGETVAQYVFASVNAVVAWLRERNVSLPRGSIQHRRRR